MTIGIFFRCPLALWTYRWLNPWYITKFYPWLFQKTNFLTDYTHFKKTMLSMLFDVYIEKWGTTSIYMFTTYMLENQASASESFDFLKNNLWY